MIYLITGVPGSGKSLYAVSTLIQKLVAEKVKQKDGSELNRRLVVDGIAGLLLPHELMAEGVEQSDGAWLPGEGNGVWNWFDWCRPGDVIVIDEVQRWWRPRGMGTKPPKMIQALETHRHMGVDFVILTQNPMLIDQNVRRLVGRHQNIRRLLGMAIALIYDWDGCSVDVNRTRTATMSKWFYPKSAYKLYQSSQLHTKQRQKVPLWLAVPVLAVIGGIFVAPAAFGTMKGAMTGKGISSTASAPRAVASAPAVVVVSAALPPASAASAPLPASASVPLLDHKLAGCISTPKKCGCFDSEGVAVVVEAGFCESHILGFSVPGQKADISGIRSLPDPSRSSGDADVFAFMAKHR